MAGLQLPADMVLAYKQYKKDTELVAGWLAQKAASCGYKPNMTTTNEPKLKGRARKLARDAAKQSGIPQPSRTVNSIKTTEFVEMAGHIAKARPKIVLTRQIHAIWERTIRARREFTAWFKAKSDVASFTDEKHSHFVTILQTALDTLKPCFEPEKAPPATAATKATTPLSTPLAMVNNMFQHLELEDTTPEEEGLANGTPNSAAAPGPVPAVASVRIEFDDKETEEEFHFAIWSFLQDIQAVRVYLLSTWQLYAGGKIELMQAACVTNLAVDMVRRAEADFESTLRRPSKYPAAKYPTGSLPFIIFKEHLPHANGGQPLEFDPDLPQTIIICGCEICDFLLYVPWAMAKSYVDVLKEEPPTLPTAKNDFSVRVPPFPNTRTYQSERYHALNPSQMSQTQLVEILPNFCMLSLMLKGAFIEDEILHAARHVLHNHNVPVWVSFALQIQLDIQRVDSILHLPAFEDLKKAYAVTKQKYKDHRKWTKSLGFEIWDKRRHNHVAMLTEQFGDWIEEGKPGKADHVEVIRRMSEGQSFEQAARESKRVPLLEYFPVTCGTMKTEMQLEWHVLGLKLVNDTGHVTLLCHLYNALHIINPKAPIWPDMELVIRNQKAEKIFIGGRPKTLEDVEKKVLMAMGMSTTSLAKDSRGVRFNKAKVHERGFDHAPIAHNLFERWLGQETRKHDEAAYRLQELLFGTKYQRDLQDRLYAVEASDSEFAEIRSQLTPLNTKMVRTLGNLAQGFMAEMPAFAFDYFSMQRTCFELYRQINKGFFDLDDIPEKLSADELMRNCPAHVTMSMIGSAVRSEAMNRMLKRKDKSIHKALGPTWAKHMKSLAPESMDVEVRQEMEQMLKATTDGDIQSVVSKIWDINEYSVSNKLFEPVLSAISGLIEQKKHDFELRKLRKLVSETSYGIFLFRHPSLENLYGPGSLKEWENMAFAESEIQRRTEFRADSLVFYVFSSSFLYQRKVLNGKGKDSHAYSAHNGLSRDEYLEREDDLRQELQKEQAEQALKDDWENCGEIYGKETNSQE
ncbi:hypothetical protein HRR83_006398 [Exophiala dermatitidis]|uniref:DUF6604 domain-containing protein n=2 Tax=Exophiala dermatitidis TaxID=5970 RepID=H6CA76_EXODN|nr:uncharacterized protein HMPREF1120_08013 [Exophiala dermatitidis NIH/UT8656]KAJ4507409.1 hypothetical protein HRR75_006758 [Exophiala dermatitidis]EHY60040.1 hypothetical protein HMPREF1120_08013 [Exophiala dermatitidis NIH/UT8656]KAJ4509402.1 hypothetical protein HRR73_007256 [Exophiala dermatitidis]KAJ4509589.1 hypothetical protein HRR74_007370 [Exophiala dermatitidis]KAJ4530596.1 hypothetical protein HRR76_008297 [Exophiala dermatitidis]